MRIDFDRESCIGSGVCESIAEDLFRVDDDGAMTLVDAVVAECRRADVERAVSRCPTGAIAIAADT
ncbi:MAG: ferredoxin [Mycobacterium sp.]|nr:ferredoxin [Mycobacterium sp.]